MKKYSLLLILCISLIALSCTNAPFKPSVPVTITLNSGILGLEDKSMSSFENQEVTLPDGSEIWSTEKYIFVGWSRSNGGDIRYKANDKAVFKKDITLYAIWQEVNEKLIFTLNEDTGTYSVKAKDTSLSGALAIPSLYADKAVTAIDANGFEGTSISSIAIPTTITAIGNNAFASCTDLTSIVLPDSIASIGSALFYNCTALETAVLPGGITELKADSESHGFFDKCSSLKSVNNTSNLITIGEHAFSECSALSSFDFPSTLTTIGKHAFFKCEKLETIDLPDSVTAIDDGAFGSCFSLKSVKLSKNLKTISSGAFGICTSLTSIEIPSNVTAIAASFVSCSSLAEIYVDNLEGSIEGSPWGADTANVYWYQSDFSITSDGILSVAEGKASKFKGSLTIPDEINGITVKAIGENAFSECTSLSAVTIPDTVTEIKDQAFLGCSVLTSITIPTSVKTIGESVFKDCTSIASIKIPSSVTAIGPSAFEGCSSLESITLSNELKTLEKGLFKLCTALKSISLPTAITSIGDAAFYNCSRLESVSIPDNVSSIGSNAFYGCMGITAIDIPSGVNSIGADGFKDCTYLNTVYIDKLEGEIEDEGENNWGIPDSAIIYYTGNYTVNDSGFLSVIDISKVPEILLLPDKKNGAAVKLIEDKAFENCTNLKSITIQKPVEQIANKAFAGCEALETIAIPDSVYAIGSSTFYGCKSLSAITLPSKLDFIGNNTFYGCKSLVSIDIPSTVTRIGENAFASCDSLTSIVINKEEGSIAGSPWGAGEATEVVWNT